MPAPSQVHINRALTDFSRRIGPGQFIRNKIFPQIPVDKESDNYFIYDTAHLRIGNDGPRAHTEPALRFDWAPSNTPYLVGFYNRFSLVTDREVANADVPLAPKQDATLGLMDLLRVGHEKRAADIAFSTTYVTQNTTLAGNDQWSDATNGESHPIDDLETAMQTVQEAIRVPDDMLSVSMGVAVWRKVRHHPDVVDRYKYTAGGGVTKAQFADLVGIKPENLNIGMSGYESADEGQTSSLANIWGKHCLVHYTNPNPGPRSISFGANFRLRKGEVQVSEWRENNPPGDNVLVEINGSQHVISTAAGYLIVNAVA